MTTLQELYQYSQNPNVRRFLDVIAQAEGTTGYDTAFGGGTIASLADHPRQLHSFTQTDGRANKTSAAGRYQFLQSTWDDVAGKLGLPDFGPQSQDIAAVELLRRNGSLEPILNGDFQTAVRRSGATWASLPSSPYAQPKRSTGFIARALDTAAEALFPSAQAGTLPQPTAWKDVIAKPEYQALSAQDKQRAQEQYFNEVVAPRAPQEQIDAVRSQFFGQYPVVAGETIANVMPLNQENIHSQEAAPAPKFDTKAAVNESLKPFPGSPDPMQGTKALGAGFVQGITDPFLGAEHWLGRGLDMVGADQTGQALVDNAAQNRQAVAGWADRYKSEAPFSGGVGRLGGNLVATARIPGVFASGVSRIAPFSGSMAPTVTRLAESIGSGGLRLGSPTGSALGNAALRSAGGTISGAATAGLVDPEDAGKGALIGAASPLILAGAGRLGGAIGRNRAAQATAQARNAPRLDTIRQAAAAGYVIPPSSVNPSLRNTVLESVSGKIATAQSASVRNQAITDGLVRKALGVADDAPLTSEMLGQYRQAAYEAGYVPLRQVGPVQTDNAFMQALDNIAQRYTGKGTIPAMNRTEVTDLVDSYKLGGFDSSDAVDAIKNLRETANDLFRRGDGALAKANRAVADALENQLERAAGATSPGLLEAFRQSRANIAKSHTVEKALREGGGSIDAAKIARELQKGAPLSGELELIGKFANAFPKAAQPAAQVAGPGVSKLAAAASTLMGGAGGVAAGPIGIGLGAVPFVVPPLVRGGLLSSAYQRGLSAPVSVAPSRVGGLLADQSAQQFINRTMPLLGAQ